MSGSVEMNAFASAHSSGVDAMSAATACLDGLPEIPPAANLGFVYVTDSAGAQLPEVLERLRERTAVEHWVGSVGIGICGTSAEYYVQPAVSLLIGAFPPDSFRVVGPVASDFAAFEDAHGSWCAKSHPYFGVVHGDPRNTAIVDLVAQLCERMSDGFLVGGLSSSRGAYAQIAGAIGEGGLSGVLFDRRVGVITRLTQGCSPVGQRHRVTRSEDNLLIEIDGRPALNVFEEDIGEILAKDLRKAMGHVFAGIPISGSDTGDYLVRSLIGFDVEHKVLAIGEVVAIGDSILFCRRDEQSARRDLMRMLAELKRSLRGTPVRGALYFSCIGRGVSLFGSESEELRIIAAELGDVPLAGFYANGEISHNRLYGYTGVLTLFT